MKKLSLVNIKRAMIEKGIPNQSRLQKLSGLGVSTISRIFTETLKSPEAKTLDALSRTLGLSYAQLLGEEPRQPEPPMDLNKEPFIEIKGRVWATPDRISIQALKGRWIKGYPGELGFFGVEIEGDSMFPAFVPGDVAIVKPVECELSPYSDADDANIYVPYEQMRRFHNKDAVVEHNEESMLKRIQVIQKGGPKYEVQMLSLNDKYPTIKVRFGDVWRMRGLVTRVHKPEVEI